MPTSPKQGTHAAAARNNGHPRAIYVNRQERWLALQSKATEADFVAGEEIFEEIGTGQYLQPGSDFVLLARKFLEEQA